MARTINCDFCQETIPALVLMTNLQDGTTLAACAQCAPDFLQMFVDALRNSAPAPETPPDEPQEAPDGEEAEEDSVGARSAKWPHTARVVPPGAGKRRRERESLAEHRQLEGEQSGASADSDD